MKLITSLMKVIIPLIGLSTFCFAQDGNVTNNQPEAADVSNKESWPLFFASDVSFRVKMPGKPSRSTDEVETPVGKLPHYVYLLRTASEYYMVTYTEFPALPNDAGKISKTLDGLRAGITKNGNKKILFEREVKIGGFTGREFLVEDGDSILKIRTFLTRKRLYQIMLNVTRQTAFRVGQSGTLPADFTDHYEKISSQFFDSFQLINGGSATSVVTGTIRFNFSLH